MTTSTTPIPYGEHAAVSHMKAIANNLPAKTGRSLDAWIALLTAEGPADARARMAWLKEIHGLGRDTAMTIVEYAAGTAEYDPYAMVEAMYAGPKAGLLPLYEAAARRALALGADVQATPCSTYVPLIRKRTFAVLKPTTRTRLDIGFALKDHALEGRLKVAKNVGSDRITHMIGVERLEDLDEAIDRFLRMAYELDA